MHRIEDEPEPSVGFDPLADLFFSIVAIVVLAIIVILPTIRPEAVADASASGASKAPTFSIDNHGVTPIRATATGLTYGSTDRSRVALDAIDSDAGLKAYLRRLRDAGLPLLVFIEPDGDEAAFSLEPVLAREGPADVTQVRLDRACGHMRNADAAMPCRVAAFEGS